ncbi:MAG: CARDB domain-containing protein [Jatrophihabitantaceae bacterium]
MAMKQLVSHLLAGALVIAGLAVVQSAAPATAAGTNLALGKTATASSFTDVYPAANVNDGNDGNANTYWESVNNAFPQWVQLDLGSSTSVNQVVLALPPATSWATRTETLSVQGSTDGSTFSTVVGSAGYTFNPATGNTVTINFTALSTRFVRLNITGNTGWPAGQLSEFQLYGPTAGDTQPPTAPGNLAYSQPGSGQVALSWTASTDNVGVTGYTVYRNGALLTSLGNVLSYTDTAAGTGTVSYYVTARDAAGNVSPASNTVTRTGSGGGSNLALGKPISGSANTYIYAPANANDNDTTTYFEGASYPSTLTVKLGANTDLSSVVLKLNPSSSWGPRSQTIQVLGREQSATGFTALTSPTAYSFDPATGNSVTVPVSGRVADVELSITSNTGAPGGQVAEFQIYGSAAPNPDLTVTGSSWTPAAPVETDSITVSATVKNTGALAAPASSVNFYLGTTKVGTAAVSALAAGASATVSANIGAQNAGSYSLTAKVDEANSIIESNETNNNYTNPTQLTVAAVSSSDLLPVSISWSPTNPAAGNTVTFSAAIKNQGSIASASGAHGLTLNLIDSSGATVKTLTGSYTGAIASGATTAPVALGSWTAVNGNYTVKVSVAVDANELAVKQANNTVSQSFFVGRGAHLPYDMYEAEDGTVGGGAAVVGPNRTIGDVAGEASGRKAVTLNSTGSYVQWTTRSSTNTLVVRYSIPDGPDSTLDVWVDGSQVATLNLTAKYSWVYGDETSPQNSQQSGTQRHIYDEAHVMLPSTVAAGHTIKLQKDSSNTTSYAIDFINTEQVAPIANPDPTRYVVPAGFSQQNVQDALNAASTDTSKLGVYLPAGSYSTSYKFQLSGRAIKVIGAGPWYTALFTPQDQSGTDAGFGVSTSANGSSFGGFSFWGNYIIRQDGPGKVFDLTDVSNITIDNIWSEHTVCFVWGTHVSNLTITNDRIRDTWADGVNLNNGSQNNTVSNDESRTTGDDSFALFAAQDHNSADLSGNTFSNLTSLLTWRAAGIAVYGGENNTFTNLYVADTLTYSGVTISSLDFGYPFQGFGTRATTISNASLVRDGGHFWGGQSFPAIWCFSASKAFQGIRVSNVDIVDPTYTGVMFQTNYAGGTAQNPVTDTVFTNVSITGAHHTGDAYDAKSGYAIWANPSAEAGQGPAVGSATFNHTTFSNNDVNVQNTTSTFTVTLNP